MDTLDQHAVIYFRLVVTAEWVSKHRNPNNKVKQKPNIVHLATFDKPLKH